MLQIVFYLALGTLSLGAIWVLLVTIQERLKRLPPGPLPIPVFGNLLQFGDKLPLDMERFGKKYGGIYRVWFGSKLAIVLSDYQYFREAFVTNSKEWSGRPLPLSGAMIHQIDNMAEQPCPVGYLFADDSAILRKRRNILHSKLLRPQRLKECVYTEVQNVVEALQEFASSEEEVDMRIVFRNVSSNVICVAGLGAPVFDVYKESSTSTYSSSSTLGSTAAARRTAGPDIKGNMYSIDKQELQQLYDGFRELAAMNDGKYISDYIPWLKILDKARHAKLAAAAKFQNEKLQQFVRKHRETLDPENPRDIVDEFLVAAVKAKEGEMVDREDYEIACIVAEIFAAGNTTTSHSLEWLFAWLATHPDLQSRLRSEVHAAFGTENIPENMDMSPLTLLDSTIKEVQRYFCPVPMWLPRRVTEDTTFLGYHIPAKTRVYANFFAVCRDPAVWSNPDKFDEERFLKPENERLLKYLTPFGMGTRSCPGAALANLEIRCVAAALLQKFEFSASKIDFDKVYGVEIIAAHPPKMYIKRAAEV